MDELHAGLAAFAASGGVRVLDIGIARSVMSEAYQRMHLAPADETRLVQGANR
jgi:hypothetical protein